jgi:AraC-like DNA-binding protein
MPASADGLKFVHFATGGLPEKHRFSVYRDLVEAGLPGIDVRQPTEGPFFASIKLRIMPDIEWGGGRFGATLNNRPRAKDNDDFVLYLNQEGMCVASQRGREVRLQPGEACLISNSEPSIYDRPTDGSLFSLRVKRSVLASYIRNLDDDVARLIPRQTEGLYLLLGYLKLIDEAGPIVTPKECTLVSGHVHDLVALILGAAGDMRAFAAERGLRAARVKAIKAHVEEMLPHGDISPDALAQRFRVSPRSIQRLFERDGTTLTEFVRDRRLARAHRMLTNQRFNHLRVGAIAYDAGFGDLSYFNRLFRHRYGASPSQIRGEHLASKE